VTKIEYHIFSKKSSSKEQNIAFCQGGTDWQQKTAPSPENSGNDAAACI